MKNTSFDPIDEFQITRRRLPHWQSPGSVYFVTTRSENRIFTERERTTILDAVTFLARKKYNLFAAVIMPDHMHLLFQPISKSIEGSIVNYYSLSEIMHSIKSYTAQQIGGMVWQHESYDHLIRNDQDFLETMNYIVKNPVKAGLVEHHSNYSWLYYSLET